MELFRLNAYLVSPQHGEESPGDPEGGAVTIGAQLRQVINANLHAANLESRTAVDFQVDIVTRTNSTRDLIIQYGFGRAFAANVAAVSLARRLADAMDRRSTPCLFVIAGFREGNLRMITLWTFPRDEAFRLHPARDMVAIEVLTDVFSQTSRLRQAAQFRGRQLRNEFLSGRVLDFQANHTSKDVADFWISRFLECRFGLGGDAGTRLLARTVRKAYEECASSEEKEKLYVAVMAMRRSPNPRISLGDFAGRYLSGRAREAFEKAVPNPESLESLFDFQQDVFDASLQFRVFQLSTGVFVSSPLEEIGASVEIIEGRQRRLSCQGEIVEEKLRTRHV